MSTDRQSYLREYRRRPDVMERARLRAAASYVPSPRGLRYKGDDVGYYGMHYRLRRDLDLSTCSACGTGEGNIDAALLHGRGDREEDGLRYSVRVDDYAPMCRPCHRAYDASEVAA